MNPGLLRVNGNWEQDGINRCYDSWCEGLERKNEVKAVSLLWHNIKQQDLLKENLRSIISKYGEGNGTPLQYSCLENPMDGGAWWAAVYGIAKSRTWLSDLTFTFHFHAKHMKDTLGLPMQWIQSSHSAHECDANIYEALLISSDIYHLSTYLSIQEGVGTTTTKKKESKQIAAVCCSVTKLYPTLCGPWTAACQSHRIDCWFFSSFWFFFNKIVMKLWMFYYMTTKSF